MKLIVKYSGETVSEKHKGLLIALLITLTSFAAGDKKDLYPLLQYSVSMPEPSNHLVHVILKLSLSVGDTIDLKMPQWMPGYYQIMNYASGVRNFSSKSIKGNPVPFFKKGDNTWQVVRGKNKVLNISYDVYSDRRFVANNYLDTSHCYIVPAATFMYIAGMTDITVSIKVITFSAWKDIATGLDLIPGRINEFSAPDFDILYDCPVLIGNLEELPSFEINGIKHRFIAYNPGNFDRDLFISGLERTIKAGIEIFGDIPYKEYTFIGIGPGAGGIEHLNNTTVSFSGGRLNNPDAMKGMLKFLAHEYFHHYNVKRIRPFELGPFEYDRENRTNLLWVSEGLSVYYEYLMVRRAGLMSDDELIASILGNINTVENDPGRQFQSLLQSSYATWDEGPFGNKPGGADRSISYYEKGPVIGMILDFSIRNATGNKKSLDDVMRFLYREYYKKLDRGFTDAEFQQACHDIAGTSLSSEFEYVYTTKEIDYSTYLSYAGLKISEELDKNTGKRKFSIKKQEKMNPLQMSIFLSWSGN